MLLSGSFLASAVVPARGQVPRDTVRQIAAAAAVVRDFGRRAGDSVWPGYRPDTIPLLFALPHAGYVLAGWRGALPAGFEPVPGIADVGWSDSAHESSASTSAMLRGHGLAQIAATSLEPTYLVSTSFHEAFHVFERASARPGRFFGQAENAFYVASYPVFDTANEAGWALEGRILAAALRARSIERKRELAQEFVAVRQARLRALDEGYADFDRTSEINEGLAEYALVRALELIETSGPPDWRPAAARDLARIWGALDSLTHNGAQSFRLRFYRSGPAMATLLDALRGSAWKQELMAGHEALDEALAVASGFDDPARALRTRAATAFGGASLRATAARDVSALEAERRAQVDSAMSRPGIIVVVRADSLPRHDFGLCGLDPQNLLQVAPGVQLHTRWVHLCSGQALDADLYVPTLHVDSTGTVETLFSPRDSVVVSADGSNVPLTTLAQPTTLHAASIVAPHAHVTSDRALVSVRGDTLRIVPLAAAGGR